MSRKTIAGCEVTISGLVEEITDLSKEVKNLKHIQNGQASTINGIRNRNEVLEMQVNKLIIMLYRCAS